MSDDQGRKTRSDLDVHIQIKDVKFYKTDLLDHSKSQMLPTYHHLYERILTIRADQSNQEGFWKLAVQELASEFICDRVKMNRYTISFNSVCKKFDKLLRSFITVKDYPKAKKH